MPREVLIKCAPHPTLNRYVRPWVLSLLSPDPILLGTHTPHHTMHTHQHEATSQSGWRGDTLVSFPRCPMLTQGKQ